MLIRVSEAAELIPQWGVLVFVGGSNRQL